MLDHSFPPTGCFLTPHISTSSPTLSCLSRPTIKVLPCTLIFCWNIISYWWLHLRQGSLSLSPSYRAVGPLLEKIQLVPPALPASFHDVQGTITLKFYILIFYIQTKSSHTRLKNRCAATDSFNSFSLLCPIRNNFSSKQVKNPNKLQKTGFLSTNSKFPVPNHSLALLKCSLCGTL